MRLNRFLARAGVASRRKSEALIHEHRVFVNNQLADHPAIRVDPARDVVTVDGRSVSIAEQSELFKSYKPRGVVSTLADEKGRPDLSAMAAALPPGCMPAGRLDRDSEGLLLWSNDGTWLQALTHPSSALPKTYRVVVVGTWDDDKQRQLEQMQTLPGDGEPLAFPVVVTSAQKRSGGEKCELVLELKEGKNRQIRRMLEALQVKVVRLVRVGEAGIDVEGLAPGTVAPVTEEERTVFLHHLQNVTPVDEG